MKITLVLALLVLGLCSSCNARQTLQAPVAAPADVQYSCLQPPPNVLFPPNADLTSSTNYWTKLDGVGQVVFYCNENGTAYDPHAEGWATLTDPLGVYTGCWYYNATDGIGTFRIINQLTGQLRVIHILSKPWARQAATNGAQVDYWLRKVQDDTESYPPTAWVARFNTTSAGVPPAANATCDPNGYRYDYTASFKFIDCYAKGPDSVDNVTRTMAAGTVPVEQCSVSGPVGTMYEGIPETPIQMVPVDVALAPKSDAPTTAPIAAATVPMGTAAMAPIVAPVSGGAVARLSVTVFLAAVALL